MSYKIPQKSKFERCRCGKELSPMKKKAKSTLYLLNIYCPLSSPGALASSCNPATWRQVLLDGLKGGLLVITGSC